MQIGNAVMVAIGMVASVASAADMSVMINHGLGGLGIDVSHGLRSDIQVRGGVNAGLSLSGDRSPDVTRYEYQLQTGYKTLGLDWHPFRGRFMLSAGYAWMDTTVNGAALPGTGATFNGVPVPTGVAAYGQVKYDSAPYFSLGWRSENFVLKGWFFNSELGIVFTGKPAVSLYTNVASFDALNAAAIEVEKLKIKQDAPDMLPIFKLGVGYHF